MKRNEIFMVMFEGDNTDGYTKGDVLSVHLTYNGARVARGTWVRDLGCDSFLVYISGREVED